MKITDKRQKQVVRFKDLEIGDTFMYPEDTDPRMKLDGDRYWNFHHSAWFCVAMMGGVDEEVIPINAELIIT